MPCQQGNRENIEASKEYYRKQKEYCPYRALWEDLVKKAHASSPPYKDLTNEELLYYSVKVLYGEIFNGGFNQFFCNSSGQLYSKSIQGLRVIGDQRTEDLLVQIKTVIFGDLEVPTDQLIRANLVVEYEDTHGYERFDEVDNKFYEYCDDLSDLVEEYLRDSGLVAPYIK